MRICTPDPLLPDPSIAAAVEHVRYCMRCELTPEQTLNAFVKRPSRYYTNPSWDDVTWELGAVYERLPPAPVLEEPAQMRLPLAWAA